MESIYHTTIPIYLILIGVSVLGMLIMCRRYYARKKAENACPAQSDTVQDIYSQPEARRRIQPDEVRINPRNLAATFSTSLNK